MSEATTKHAFPWPSGASAAVSLSYDDGEPDNLDHAIPDLEAAGLRGTFYLYKTGPASERIDEWRSAFERGHEIGNHTVRHACRADSKTPPRKLKNPLENYQPADIAAELDEAANWLDQTIGKDPDRTFAYPCGDTAIGVPRDEASYRDAISRHHRVARAGKRRPNDPRQMDPLHVTSHWFVNNTVAEFIGACEQGIAAGGWTVLVFHSIGGRNHNTERDVHRALLDELSRMPVWVAPVRDVAEHIFAHRSASGA